MTDPRRRTLLIADDHEHVGASLKALLAPDYDVVAIIPTGNAVVEAVQRLKPDAVLLDLWLPGLTGSGVLRAFHARKALVQLGLGKSLTLMDDGIDLVACRGTLPE